MAVLVTPPDQQAPVPRSRFGWPQAYGRADRARVVLTMPLEPTHAYLAIYGGQCEAIQVDAMGEATARFVADVVRRGGYIERVPLEVARSALFEPWPQRRKPDLPRKETT